MLHYFKNNVTISKQTSSSTIFKGDAEMTLRSFFAFSLALLMLMSMAACGGKDDDTTTLPADETTEAVESETESVTDDMTDISEEPSQTEEETSADVAETETAEPEKFDLNTTEGVINLYKEAAAKTEKAGITSDKVMSLASLDGGKGFVGGIISAFEPIARRALANNSVQITGIEGSYDKLSPSDVKSAKAVDNGKTTTLIIELKDQTDGVTGNQNGPVAHGVGVLDSIETALAELKGVTFDYSEGTVKLKYTDATINVTIDNATGKITSGKWRFDVNISLDNIGAKIGVLSVTLKDAKGVVKYEITH